MSIVFSLDNLTIVGNYRSDTLDKELRPLLDTLPLVKNVNVTTFGLYQYNAYCESGVFIQLGKDIQSDRKIRVEFNPNKLNERYERDVMEILKFIRYPHFSRRDIACDLFDNWDINDWSYWDYRSRKRITYESGSRQLETLYMGSKDSDEQIRIYDKAKETGKDLIKEGTKWMRIEAQMRKEKAGALMYNPFTTMKVIRKEGAYKNLDWKIRAQIEFLENHPSAWIEVGKELKAKLRKIIKENTDTEVLEIDKEYDKWMAELEADAQTWLQCCAMDKLDMIELYERGRK